MVSASPNIQVVQWTPDNVSCNGLLNITNSSVGDTWSIELLNITPGIEYRIYNESGELVDYALAGEESATLEITGIEGGIYKIVELSEPQLLRGSWNLSSMNPAGVFNTYQSSGYNNINISILNATPGAMYWIYRPSDGSLLGSGTSYINTIGLVDDEYWILQAGLEQIKFTSWTPDNAASNGIFEITNSTYASNFTFNITEVNDGAVYKLIANNTTSVIASGVVVDGIATIRANGLLDGEYKLVKTGNQSYVKPALIIGSLITISYVLASTFNRRRRHE